MLPVTIVLISESVVQKPTRWFEVVKPLSVSRPTTRRRRRRRQHEQHERQLQKIGPFTFVVIFSRGLRRESR